MIEINQGRCIRCMSCLSVCPFTVLKDVDGVPTLSEDKFCLKCMHCGAICPTEAITYGEKPSIIETENISIKGNEFVKELTNHILSRRSYRHFSREQVPGSIIDEALRLSAWAPSAKNQHTTKWIVIESQDIIVKIMENILEYVEDSGVSPEIASEMKNGNNVVMGTATTLILAYANDKAISPETDTAIAMTTAELYLQAKGVGTCWAGYLKRMCNGLDSIKELLPELPPKHSFYGAFMVGYPENEKYLHIPDRIKRADIKWI